MVKSVDLFDSFDLVCPINYKNSRRSITYFYVEKNGSNLYERATKIIGR